MKLIPVLMVSLGAALLAVSPVCAQSAPERDPNGGVPPPMLNNVTADNQQAGQPVFTFLRSICPGGNEQALRHQIETLSAGQPDYGAMEPKVADQWRSQVDRVGPVTRQWGALVSLKHYPLHGSLFEARFENARVRWEIACQNSQGKITGISFKTLS